MTFGVFEIVKEKNWQNKEIFKASYGSRKAYCNGWGYTEEQAKRNAKNNWDSAMNSRPGSEDKGYVSNYRNHSAYR